MVHLLAFSLQDQVEKYGAYIGIAAFFGLAVLTILYFAQAKELRRLRDWAGRAPERAQEIEARAVAQAEAARRVQAQPRRTPAPATPGAATGAATATAAAGAAAAKPAGQGEPATQVVEPAEGAPQVGNGTAAAASEAGEGEEPKPAGGNGDTPTGGAKAAGAAAAAAAAKPEGEEKQAGEEAEKPPEAAKPDAEQKPAEGDAEKAPEPEAAKPDAEQKPAPEAEKPPEAEQKPAPEPDKQPAAEDEQDSAEVPVAPIPRATPLPRRAPAPAAAAPLRQPSRSATLPPRRPAPAGRGASAQRQPARGGGGRSRLVPVLVGAGALVLAVAALFATGVLGGGEDTPSAPNSASNSTPSSTSEPSEQQLTPASTKVAVLNGTTIPGLASGEKDTLTDAGYNEIATGNNTDQQRAESAVLYGTRSGARAQARSVARRLDIANVQRLDADTRDLSEGADVVVILGQDKAP